MMTIIPAHGVGGSPPLAMQNEDIALLEDGGMAFHFINAVEKHRQPNISGGIWKSKYLVYIKRDNKSLYSNSRGV